MFGSGKPPISARELLDGCVQRLLAIKHLLLFGFVVLIFGCFVDFATVTGPQLSETHNAQGNLGRWPMPAALKSNMNADLNLLVFYVVAGEVAKWLIVFVGFCFVFLAVDVIIVTLSFCFQRSSSVQGAVDLATLFTLEKGLFRREQTANWCLNLTIMGAVFVSLFLNGAEVWLPSAFFLLFALIEGWKSLRQNNLIFALPRSQRGPAFNWLTQRGWYDFLAPLLGGLALVYFLFPALYVAALLLMKKQH